jgi:heterodisulfide reductase subunit A
MPTKRQKKSKKITKTKDDLKIPGQKKITKSAVGSAQSIKKSKQLPKGALIIGGGISGIQAALDLAEAGIMAYVVERSTSIGGRMAQLDKTFPTNDCAMCILSPKLVAAARHPNITLITNAEVSSVSGEAGNFSVQVTKYPRYLDEDKCVGCGECATKCPTKIPSEFDLGLDIRKAIYLPFPQAVPMVYCIDEKNCLYLTKGKCGVCAKICKADAIDFEQKTENISIDIGAIIVSTGYDQFDPSILAELGYSKNKNVITGLEFERLLNASGPTGGKILRPSDEKSPKKILFVQCVGSRDKQRAFEYCSRICCMYAIKEALIAKEHQHDLSELTILNMEIRAYGKGFEEYYQRAKKDGVNFIKGRAAEINEEPKTGKITVTVEDIESGEVRNIETDLVVLSSAVVPNKSNEKLAKTLDIRLDEHGFFKECSLPESATESSREGIFLSGCAQGPKDIPDSVAQGSAAAAMVEKYLIDSKTKPEVKKAKKYEKEKEITETLDRGMDTSAFGIDPKILEPRIGVFVCHCGINIAGVLDIKTLVEYSKELPDVVFATDNLYTCSDDAQRYIQEMIKEHDLTRVIVASCTPRTHEPIFKDTCERAGLNPYLFDMTNIRDQCSWVHMNEPEAATEKAKDLISMAVARSRLLRPLIPVSTPINQSVLVIGGGIAGIQCALDLANQGIDTTLLEHEPELGGRIRQLNKLAYVDLEPKKLLADRTARLKKAGVKLYLGHQISDISGYVGNFAVTLEPTNTRSTSTSTKTGSKNKKDKKIEKKDQINIQTGAIVLAIGSSLHDPKLKHRFGYGKYANVISNLEFENILKGNSKTKSKSQFPKDIKNITFVQCVGSREHDQKGGNTACSRYCCQTTLHQALEAAEEGANVTVLHRGIRAFSKYAEELYYKASEMGIRFIQYPDEANLEPKIINDNKGKVKRIRTIDISLGQNQEVDIPSDLIVLALAMVPRELETEQLQKWLKVPRSADGFFLELHPKLAPVETNTTGIYVCGCAQGPKDITDTMSQASAAAAKAAALVSNDELSADPVTARVNAAICWGCGTCEELCSFGAAEVTETETGAKISNVKSALCKGCGVCAANCPSGAMTIYHFTNDQIDSMIKAFGEVAE